MSFFKELKRRNVVRVGIAYTVATWLLIQVTDTVFPRIGLPDSAVTLVIALLFIGFIPALIFAWAFEMTPEGIKREKEVDRTQSITPQTGRKLDHMIIGIMAVVIAFLILDRFVLQDEYGQGDQTTPLQNEAIETTAESTEEAGPSVAVLPFINMSGDANNEYFSDGLTETLLHMLAQIPGLHVAARTSSFAFKGKQESINKIAVALGVAHILEGSVQKAGNQVRITAQLIRAEDGFHVWSQNYDRNLDNIFEIQDEIAADVVAALDESLLGNTKQVLHGVSTSDLPAYDSYLKGLEQQALFSYGSLTIAEGHFKEALAHDPGFTDARIALIRNYLLKKGTGFITIDEMLELVQPLIQQVSEQEPDNKLGRAYELATEIAAGEFTASRDEMELVVAELYELLILLPSETYIRTMMTYPIAYFFEQHQQAIDLLQAGLIFDPLHSNLYLQQARIYRDDDRLGEARVAAEKARQLEPGSPNAYSQMAHIESKSGNLPGKLKWYRRAMAVDPQDHELAAYLAYDFYDLALPEEGDRWYAKVKALAPASAVTRSVELLRAVSRNETEQVLSLARSMISDQVDMRDGAFVIANIEFADQMLKTGRAKEAYDFLVSLRPEISNYQEMPEDAQGQVMQRYSILLMTGFASPETRKAAWAKFTVNLDNDGIPWRNPKYEMAYWDYIINGEIDTAVENFLEYRVIFPVSANLWQKREILGPFFGELISDPRVAATLIEYNKEYDEIRAQVQQLIQEPEWTQ